MSKAVIVAGEASETDSEDDTPIYEKNTSIPVRGKVVMGEDSESENESNRNAPNAASTMDQVNVQEKSDESKYNSLLHQKLKENNIHLRNNIETFWLNAINKANKTLEATDQNLIKSQVTIQNGVTALKNLNNNSLMIKNKLHSFLSAKFLSNVIDK